MGRKLFWVRNLIFGIGFILFFMGNVMAVVPFGVETLNVVNTTTATPTNAASHSAQAGNVTELNIFGISVTQSWQGYFGNVSGALVLQDSSGNAMYNWSLANPEGEIYASRKDSVSWENIECFNWSENGAWLEANFSIDPDDVDGVDETFSYDNNHNQFWTNSRQFNEGQCMSTTIFDSSGSGENNYFQEILLWDGEDVVFASLLEESSVSGFDGRDHDFQMLVLEDGHGADTDNTVYYFYVELQ